MENRCYFVFIYFFCFLLNSCGLNILQNEAIDDEFSTVGFSLQANSKEISKNEFVLEGSYGEDCAQRIGGKVWKLYGGEQIHVQSLSIKKNDINCKIYLTKIILNLESININYNLIYKGKNRYVLMDSFSNNFFEFRKDHNLEDDFDEQLYARVKLTKGDLSLPPTLHLHLRRMQEFNYRLQGKNNKIIDYTSSKAISELSKEAIYRVYPFGKSVYAIGYKNKRKESQGGLFYSNDFLKKEFKKVESIKSDDVRNMIFDSGFIYVANFGGESGLYYTSYSDNLNFKMVQDPLIVNKKIRFIAASGKNIYVVVDEHSLYFTTQGIEGNFKRIDNIPEQINGLHLTENKVIITTKKNIFFTKDLTSGVFYKNEYDLQNEFISEISVAKDTVILGGRDGIYISKNGIEGKFSPQKEMQGKEIYNLFLQDNLVYASVMCTMCGDNYRMNSMNAKLVRDEHTDGIYVANLAKNPIVFKRIVRLVYPMSFTLFNDKALISTPYGLSYFE